MEFFDLSCKGDGTYKNVYKFFIIHSAFLFISDIMDDMLFQNNAKNNIYVLNTSYNKSYVSFFLFLMFLCLLYILLPIYDCPLKRVVEQTVRVLGIGHSLVFFYFNSIYELMRKFNQRKCIWDGLCFCVCREWFNRWRSRVDIFKYDLENEFLSI